MKRYLVLAVLICFGLVGCAQDAGESGGNARPDEDVIAQVAGESITEGDIEEIISHIPAQYRAKYSSLQGRKEIVDGLVEMKMLAWEARRKGIDTQESVKAKIGYAIDQILAKELENGLKKSVKVSETDIEGYYREHLDRYVTPERVKARHILVEKQGLADDLLSRLKKGADFQALAKKHSTCPSADKGGDLGWFGRGKMAPEFEKAVFALNKGELGDVVKSSFGYHVIRLEDKREPKTKTLDQVRKSIERTLRKKQAEARMAELKDEISKKAGVTVNDGYFSRFPALGRHDVEKVRELAGPEEE